MCFAYVIFGGHLSPEKVYASMMILMHLSACLLLSHQGRMTFVNFKLISKRIEEILTTEDVHLDSGSRGENILPSSLNCLNQIKEHPIKFTNFTGYWSKTAIKPCLKDINLSFQPGTLTAVIGKVGSGKSSLLLSFLREIPMFNGSLDYQGKIAYVEQDPIIFSGTFRDNILFGREYNETLYKQIISDCNLETDLAMFPNGDLSQIGERGTNLSGGQKARVSLARAVYSESDIYLLDDPFSALDCRVARDIFERVVKENLVKNKSVILVTHHLHYAKEADHIVVMNEGAVEAQGTFSELENLDISLLNIMKVQHDKNPEMDETVHRSSSMESVETRDQTTTEASPKEAFGNAEDSQRKLSNPVTWSTYKNYLKLSGSWPTLTMLVSLFVVSHALVIAFTRFIGNWAENQSRYYHENEADEYEPYNLYYGLVSGILLTLLISVSYLKALQLNRFLLKTNTELHRRMLDSLIRSKVLFFDTFSVGRILNRFSNDLGLLDKTNTLTIFETIDYSFSYISLLLTVCVVNPPILIPSLFVLYGLYRARKFFRKPMGQVKKLELSMRSPLISSVSATLHGLMVIRGYNQGTRFVKDFMDRAFDCMKTYVFQEKTIRLFAFILDTPIQLLTLSGIWIFIAATFYYNVRSALLGLCLMYLLRIGDLGSMIIRWSIYVDINMQSAQRGLDFCNLDSEVPKQRQIPDRQAAKNIKGKWPSRGEVAFNEVSLKYRDDLKHALNKLSFQIKSGTKVACVGRTGAGKSSIIQTLFRMVEIQKGSDHPDSRIMIDDVDISSVSLKHLRSKLSIIPQVPVVFSDTIRNNLDPLSKFSDQELWNVLEDVNLKSCIESLPDKLNTDLTACSNVFSTGQKQLVCLARVIINKNNIVILDEATANVDVETDNFIQNTIINKFKDCTVLTIAHRLSTIAHYDKVLVMDKGTVAEYDAPYNLLVEKIGDSEITKEHGIFADMVRSTGPSMAKRIFEVARVKFYQNTVQQIETSALPE